ncbi:MAG: amino acid adenylation domain-containing protein [Pseudomonadota bacterium]
MNKKLLPLCSNQYDIWRDQQIYKNSPMYNIGGSICIKGQINIDLLRQAINQLIIESDSLRLLFIEKAGKVYQFLGQENFPEMEFIDFSNQKNSGNKIQQWLKQTFSKLFTINNTQYLYHYALLKESDNCFHLMGKFHHLIFDGLSSKIASDKLADIYNALLNNSIEGFSNQNKKSFLYSDYIDLQQQYLQSKSWLIDEQYWLEHIPVLPEPLLPIRYPKFLHSLQKIKKRTYQLPKTNIHKVNFDKLYYSKIKSFASSHNSSAYHVFLLILGLYFSRNCQRDDILMGIPSLNRSGKRFKEVLGMFSTLSPLLLKVNKDSTFIQLMENCGITLRKMYRHQRFPLSDIIKHLKLLQHNRDSLFDIVVSYERHEYSSQYGGVKMLGEQLFSGEARYPLAMIICEFSQDSGVEVVFEAAETVFSQTDLKLLGKRFQNLLFQVLELPDQKISDFNTLTENEDYFIYKKFNHLFDNTTNKDNTTTNPQSFLELFASQVRNTPDITALEYLDAFYSYRQLDKWSNRLAHYLVKEGAQAEQIIALCLPRCSEMIVAILAILKSGAAYLPIDPDLPEARILKIVNQAKPLLTLKLEDIQNSLINNYSEQNLPVVINENQLAYIIFTSGTSGEPKGVMIEHKALNFRLNDLQEIFKIQKNDRVGQNIAYNFDPSIIEIFLPLINGATLVLAPQNCENSQIMVKFVIEKQINMLALVPSSLSNLMLGLEQSTEHSLRVVCSGGEVLSPVLAEQFTKQTGINLYNVYGPTEATILTSSWLYHSHFTEKVNYATLPLGQTINNSSIFIIDKQHKLLPIGEIGEIVISGAGLARGYITDKQLTEQKFVQLNLPISLNSNKQIRCYKTGDQGFIGTDALLYYCGRMDRQLKLSGYRVEPGEIEHVLLHHQQVSAAVVKLIGRAKSKKLVAYIETNCINKEYLINELKGTMSQQLPIYMQPAAIVSLKIFPLLSTGKVDMSALPDWVDINTNTYIAPRTVMEKQLLTLWQETLTGEGLKGIERKKIGIHDNFFSLGGDSLAAINYLCKLDNIAEKKPTLSFLLENPTIFKQAKLLSSSYPVHILPALTTLSSVSKLSSNPPDFFLMASGHGDTIRFNHLASMLQGVCQIHMLQPESIADMETSINSLAKQYAKLILEQTARADFIGGFSIAGITALATARELEKMGKPVKGVILLDSVYPLWPLKSKFIFEILPIIAKFLHFNKVLVNGRRLDAMLADPGIKVQLNAVQKHAIEAYTGSVALFISKNIFPKFWLFHKWNKLLGKNMQKYFVQGLHGAMFSEANIGDLSKKVKDYILLKK